MYENGFSFLCFHFRCMVLYVYGTRSVCLITILIDRGEGGGGWGEGWRVYTVNNNTYIMSVILTFIITIINDESYFVVIKTFTKFFLPILSYQERPLDQRKYINTTFMMKKLVSLWNSYIRIDRYFIIFLAK